MRLREPIVPMMIQTRPQTLRVDARRQAPIPAPLGTMDKILRSCPTDEEIHEIHRDFLFTFDSKPAVMRCSRGGDEYGVLLTLYDAFRCMRALTFESAIPLIGATNLYDWLKAGRIVGVHVQDSDEFSHIVGPGWPMYIRRDVLAGGWNRQWDNGVGLGMKSTIALLVHEGAHVILGKVHDCSGAEAELEAGWHFKQTSEYGSGTMYRPDGTIAYVVPLVDGHKRGDPVSADGRVLSAGDPLLKIPKVWGNDSTLEYGGAWAAQYWFNVWLADRSGANLTGDEKASAAASAHALLTSGRLSCGKPLAPPSGLVVASPEVLKLPPGRADRFSHLDVQTARPSSPVALRTSGASVGETSSGAAPIVLGGVGTGILLLAQVATGVAVLPLAAGILYSLLRRSIE